jgi:hypothetical protein
MSTVNDYTQAELDKLLAAPLIASMYIMGSSLSGPVGLVKEMMAGVETAMDASKNAAPGTLFSGLWSEENMKARQDMMDEARTSTEGAQDMTQAKAQMLSEMKQAAGILAAKGSPEELGAFRQLMVQVAQKVADAAKEGGFMGIGGVQVNDAERQAITDIRGAIGAVG